MTNEEPWVDVDIVASHLGVAKDTVYRWIGGKGLPAHRLGRLLRLKISEVDTWVQGGRGGDRLTGVVSEPSSKEVSRRRGA